MRRKNSIFTETPAKAPSRNRFDLSHEVKMSGKFSFLYPVLIQETLPGDKFSNTSTIMMRFAPMLAPIMHRIDVTTHYFYVPYRLLTDIWEDFITGGQDGTLAPVLPFVRFADVDATEHTYHERNTLWDYLGLPVVDGEQDGPSVEEISVLPFRAYAKIWNDWYRDPNFDEEIDLNLPLAGNVSAVSLDGGDGDIFNLKRRAWRKDYFTSALIAPQRGLEVLMPLAGTADVTYKPISTVHGSGGVMAAGDIKNVPTTGAFGELNSSANQTARIENIQSVEFDSSDVSINDFRVALATQAWLENNARGGYRYTEQISSHFSVNVPDYRLQRAEYLGGGRQPVRISEVLATAETGGVFVGDMAGHGISVGKSNSFSYFCPEHGIILGIMSVRPESSYSQGIDRMWSRKTKFDFAWPEMAHLGEQSILGKELYFAPLALDDAGNASTFGYVPRYAEYKFKSDRIAGDMRDTLAFWHLGRLFTSRPALDEIFTTTDENSATYEESMRRIFAVNDGTDYLWIDIFHRFTAQRPLPYFGVPRIMG